MDWPVVAFEPQRSTKCTSLPIVQLHKNGDHDEEDADHAEEEYDRTNNKSTLKCSCYL